MHQPWSRFIDEPIEVALHGDVREPESFVWRGARHEVRELVHAWSDWGFSEGAGQRNWRTRRHRNYFRVRTTEGRVFEIYLDRGARPGSHNWFLLQELGSESLPPET
jgi:hypothetical protein